MADYEVWDADKQAGIFADTVTTVQLANVSITNPGTGGFTEVPKLLILYPSPRQKDKMIVQLRGTNGGKQTIPLDELLEALTIAAQDQKTRGISNG